MSNRVDRELWTRRLRAIGLSGRLPERLTEKVVEATKKPTGERYQLADGRGLALCVYPDGSASYVLQARTLAGQPKRIGLGSAAAVSLEQARAAADEARAVLKAGGDPVADKRSRRAVAVDALASTVRNYLQNTYVKHMESANRKDADGTKARILASWKPLVEVPLAHLTDRQINDVIEARKARTDEEGEQLLSNATLRRDWAVFRSMLADAQREGVIEALPIAGVPTALRGLREEPARRYIGQDDTADEKAKGTGERGRFLKALDAFTSTEPGGAAFIQTACVLSLNTGCRRGEMLAITDSMIRLNDPGYERIELPGAITKSGKPRDLYLNADAIAAIKRWREVRKTLPVQGLKGELFPAPVCNWKERITQREFPRLCVDAKIKGIVFKTLRATFASLHVQGGTPLRDVQKMLGHASLTTTEKHYAYLAPDAGRSAARAFKVS